MKYPRLPILGETLYSLNVGNAAKNCEKILTPVEVTKVGRKYFEITFKDHWRPIVFHIDNWYEKTEYSSDFSLYESPQQWEDEKEFYRLREIILKAIEYGENITLKNLQDIYKIIEISPNAD